MLRLCLLSLVAVGALGAIVYTDNVTYMGTDANGVKYYTVTATTTTTTTTTTWPFLAYTNLVAQWVSNISSSDAVAGCYPDPINTLDGTQTVAESKATWTPGYGGGLTFDNTDYILVNDNDLLSFGDSTNDRPFSIALFSTNLRWNITNIQISKRLDQAAARAEWELASYSGARYNCSVVDANFAGAYERGYNNGSEITPLLLTVATYSGVGGETAQSGILLYTNGVAVSMSTVDGGSYVAMHNSNAKVCIGGYGDTSANYDNAFNAVGTMYDVMLFDKALSLTEITNLLDYCKKN